MAARPVQRNNVIAGMFLIGSLFLAIFVSFMLSDAMDRFGTFREYTFRFEVFEGVSGVKIDSPVTLGGYEVGRVIGVAPVYESVADSAAIALSVDVRVEVTENVVLYTNADAYVVTPILGTMASINIAHPGGPDKRTGLFVEGTELDVDVSLLGPDDPLNGALAPALLAQMGFGPEESQLVRQMLIDAGVGVGNFRDLSVRAGPALDDGAAAIATVRETAELISDRADQVSVDVVAIAEDVRASAARFGPTLDEVDAILSEARATVTDVRAAVAENRPVILRASENVERITQRAELQTMDKLEAVLDEGLIAAGNFSDTGARADALLAQSAPNLRRAVANARVISDQASLFIQEVRAAPWRLLERPKGKEVREQLLYDATRTYASAVGDLRSASETLDAALASINVDAPARGLDPDGLSLLAGDLRRAFGDYRRAESALLELVTDGAIGASED
ncbi:MAG: hypothetical protein AAF297_04035 [Planctomycetota bacterium]